MSVGGITELGLYNTNTLLVETERQMILAHLCSLQQVHQIVVDSGITPQWKQTLEDAGVKVLVAS